MDDGFEEGMDIPIYYDPMISKLITFGKDRAEAISRMIRAIDDYHITGVQTTLPFCKFVMKHEAFVSGEFDTNFVKKYFHPEMLSESDANESIVASLVTATLLSKKKQSLTAVQGTTKQPSKWKANRVL